MGVQVGVEPINRPHTKGVLCHLSFWTRATPSGSAPLPAPRTELGPCTRPNEV